MTEMPTKREQAREERRSQILEAALAVFTEKGFHTANVSDVAARVGVSQGTIYWYFDSKEELFEAAILHKFMSFGAGALGAIEEQETATEKLLALSEGMAELVKSLEGMFMMFLAYWASSPNRELAGEWWVNLLIEYKDLVTGIIQEGVDQGEFKEVDAESLVWALLAAYDGLAAYDMVIPNLDMNRISRTLAQVIVAGLQAEPGAEE